MQKIKILLFVILLLFVMSANSIPKPIESQIRNIELHKGIGSPKSIWTKIDNFPIEEGIIVFNTNTNDPAYPKGYYYWSGTDWLPAYGQKPQGSLRGDLEALYAIQTSLLNPDVKQLYKWDIDLENINNPKNFDLPGVFFGDVNGEKRVVHINLFYFTFENITIEKGLEALLYLRVYDNIIKSLNLTLPNLVTLLVYDNNAGLLRPSSQLTKINLNLKNAKSLIIERVRCLREFNADVPAVTTLFYASNGCIATLDLNKMNSLKKAILNHNTFSTLAISECKELEEVEIESSQIENLDFSNNPKLSKLSIQKDDTPQAKVRLNLDISRNTNLKKLYLRSVYLPSIDISNNINLEYFYDRYCDYDHIDLTKNTKLKSFVLFRNYKIRVIDLSNCKDLIEMALIDNMVKDLNLKNCGKLKFVTVDRSDGIATLDLSMTKNLSVLKYADTSRLKNIIMCSESPYAENKTSDDFYTILDCK